MVKLIWGGNGGTAIQLWSQGGIDQLVTLQVMSDAAVAAGGAGFATVDVASVELAMGLDKAGTVAASVTLFDGLGAVLGGVRPTATPGYATAPAQALPPAVAAAIADGTSVFGVTSNDYDQPAGDAVASFEAAWDSLTLTSPQAVKGPAPDAFAGADLGDLSDDNESPTDLGTLALGDSVLRATQQGDAQPGGRDYDYVTFTVAEGQVLSQLVLAGYESEDPANQGFLGLIEGTAMPAPPQSQAEYEALASQLLGGVLTGGSGGLGVGFDLLGEDGLGSGEVQGQTTMAFDAPLGAGTYTLWFSQGGAPSTSTLQFKVSSATAADALSIAAAPSVVEGGDDGATALAFPLGAPGFEGEMTVSYEAGGVAGSQLVTFAAGVGTLTIEVANDDADTGDTTVSVTLTDATVGADSYAIDAGAASAAGTVTEDDASGGGASGGTGPDDDLDGDGIANAADPDVDGDLVANEDETFRYDATGRRAGAGAGTERDARLRHRRHAVAERPDGRASQPRQAGARGRPRERGRLGRRPDRHRDGGRPLQHAQHAAERLRVGLQRPRGPARRDALRRARLRPLRRGAERPHQLPGRGRRDRHRPGHDGQGGVRPGRARLRDRPG